jgi:hypothetical protein
MERDLGKLKEQPGSYRTEPKPNQNKNEKNTDDATAADSYRRFDFRLKICSLGCSVQDWYDLCSFPTWSAHSIVRHMLEHVRRTLLLLGLDEC